MVKRATMEKQMRIQKSSEMSGEPSTPGGPGTETGRLTQAHPPHRPQEASPFPGALPVSQSPGCRAPPITPASGEGVATTSSCCYQLFSALHVCALSTEGMDPVCPPDEVQNPEGIAPQAAPSSLGAWLAPSSCSHQRRGGMEDSGPPDCQPCVLTCGCTLHIGVEKGDNDVDKNCQVEGNAAPEGHATGEPIDKWHTWERWG